MKVTEQIEAFNNDRINIGFSRPLLSAIADDFVSHNVYIDQLVAIVNQSHTLASQKTIDLTQLKEEKFIIFNRDEALGLFDETIMICRQAGFSPNIVSQPKHVQTLVTEVAAGLGVAIAPYCVRKLYSEGCHFIALNNVNKQIPVQIQFKKNEVSATVSAFVDIAFSAKNDIQSSMTI